MQKLAGWMASMALMALIGCGQGVGADGVIVGGDCELSSQCAHGSHCLSGTRFPEGTCSRYCDADADCPQGSSCVQDSEAGGVCLLDCTGGGCREGYQCLEWDARGALGTTMVCVNPY